MGLLGGSNLPKKALWTPSKVPFRASNRRKEVKKTKSEKTGHFEAIYTFRGFFFGIFGRFGHFCVIYSNPLTSRGLHYRVSLKKGTYLCISLLLSLTSISKSSHDHVLALPTTSNHEWKLSGVNGVKSSSSFGWQMVEMLTKALWLCGENNLFWKLKSKLIGG